METDGEGNPYLRRRRRGGGSDSRAAIRDGFNQFLSPLRRLAQQSGTRWRLVACGPRRKAFEAFRTSLQQHPDALNVLLVDSEGPVTATAAKHLEDRDRWDVFGVADESCHLMVHTVEAWLVADPEALARFYGQGFLRNALPKQENVEEIEKDQLFKRLDQATKRTQKGRYHKILHCSLLLAVLDQRRVRSRARHCDLLFKTLEDRLAG